MYDNEQISYTIKEINKRKGTPYIMSNEILADYMFPSIKRTFPEAQLIKTDGAQCILVSKRARISYVKKLKERQNKYKNGIEEIDNIIQILANVH